MRQLLICLVAMLGLSGLARADDLADCKQAENWGPGLKACNKILATDPRNAVALAYRGWFNAETGHPQLGLADCGAAKVLKPGWDVPYNVCGEAYSRMGDCKKAIPEFNRAIEIKPDFWGALNNRGECFRMMGKLDRALADFDAAEHIQPNGFRIYRNRGRAYLSKHDNDAAIADFTKYIALKPQLAFGYCKRSQAYDAKHDAARAKADREAAVAHAHGRDPCEEDVS